MNLSEIEVKASYYAVSEFVRHRRQHGAPVPAPVRRLFDRLDYIARWGVDPADTPTEGTADDISTTEAAAILGCSTRHVRRIAADLDGIRVGRDWIFNRHTVTEYATARTAA